jgi:hypothetical protein
VQRVATFGIFVKIFALCFKSQKARVPIIAKIILIHAKTAIFLSCRVHLRHLAHIFAKTVAKRNIYAKIFVKTSEVGKLRSNTLRPTHKLLTRPVGDTVYTNKKCVIERLHLFFGTAGNVEV